LKNLTLQKTKVTAAEIDELKKALPRCRIEWDGGVVEPKVGLDLDRLEMIQIVGSVSDCRRSRTRLSWRT